MQIGLMAKYQMFTTMLLSMLHNYETRISLWDSNVVVHEVIFVANKNPK